MTLLQLVGRKKKREQQAIPTITSPSQSISLFPSTCKHPKLDHWYAGWVFLSVHPSIMVDGGVLIVRKSVTEGSCTLGREKMIECLLVAVNMI